MSVVVVVVVVVELCLVFSRWLSSPVSCLYLLSIVAK